MKDLKDLLNRASSDERQALADILEATGSSTQSIVDAFWQECQSIFGYVFGGEPTWTQIVQQVAKKLDVDFKEYEIAREVEVRVAQKVMETVWEDMTPKQREEMEEKLRATAAEFDKGKTLAGSASIFGALTAAHLSGFGVYLLGSTTLGAIAGALGVTLPFAVYTTMTSAIAVVTGPAGWIGAALLAIWGLTGPNHKKLISAVLFVCLLRARIDGGFE